jgi:LiaI-LiaF-like transmembrane region
MSNGRPRGSSVFSGLLLIFIGGLLLLHNYRGLEIGSVLRHWWPLILIVWGALKLYERTVGRRAGDPSAARITPGEVFLVLGLMALVGAVVTTENVRDHFRDWTGDWGNTVERDLDVAPTPVPANARITVRASRGDINVRSSDEAEIRVNGKKGVKSWNENEARKIVDEVSVEIAKQGDGFEVRPAGGSESRVSMDMDVVVPRKANLTVRNDKGDISVADMATSVNVNSGNGDVEIRNTDGDVNIDMRRGDAKVSSTKGDVKISGGGDSAEVTDATGSLTVNGEFVGPVRADKVARGVRYVSHRTDLTVTQLGGHMEVGSGNIEIVDAPGNVNLRTHEEEISLENVGGKIKVDNRNGNIEVRFSSPPKEDVEVYNASAAISLSLPSGSNFQIVADCHSGEIDSEFEADTLKQTSTDSGDAHLEGRYGNGRGPKITIKTSYGSISIHKTN